jgi:hypothetical protein
MRWQSSYGKVIAPADYKGMLDWIEYTARDVASQMNREFISEAEKGHINISQKQTIVVFNNIAREARALRDLLRAESRREVEMRAEELGRVHSRERVLQTLKAQKRKTSPKKVRRSQKR